MPTSELPWCSETIPAARPDAASVKVWAAQLGFDLCGITGSQPSEYRAYFHEWIARDQAGEMGWLTRAPERRAEPALACPGTRSIIVVGLNYWQEQPQRRGRIARYALGDDYHEIMQAKLEKLSTRLQAAGAAARVYVDTGPILEKPLAQRAGLGWQGKSTLLIQREFGPWLLLGEILTDAELTPDPPGRDHCGSCQRCLTACPTGAITAPYQLDARRCIAYLTIELKGSIPVEFRPLIGDRIYGCDECLEVCPWNRFARAAREPRLAATRATRPAGERDDLHALLEITPAEFKRRFVGSPILRTKRRGLLRNVCVALGNIGTADDLPVLRKAAEHTEPLVREHAAWAIEQIEKRVAQAAMAGGG